MRVLFYTLSSGRSPVEEFITSLSKADQARFAEVYQGLKDFGFDCPRVEFRQLRGKLWELKFSSKSGGHWIAYVMVESAAMVWLHAFKKTTRKTPAGDLALAEKRMKEIL